MNNLTFTDFRENFAVFNNAFFFLFQLEKMIKRNINEDNLKILFSSRCTVEYDSKKYYVPFGFENSGRTKFTVTEVIENFKKIPIFEINLNGRNIASMSIDHKLRSIRNEHLYTESIEQMSKLISNKILRFVETDLSKYDNINPKLLKIFRSAGIEFEEYEKYIVLDTTVITKIPNILVPEEHQGKDLIHENFRFLYHSAMKNERVISLGFYKMKNNKVIDLHPEHHLAIFDTSNNEIYDILA